MSFDLNKFRKEFLQSDGWKVSDCYKPYDDKFLRQDAQDAYEGAKWGYEAGAASRQGEVDELKSELEILQGMHNAVSLEAGNLVEERNELQTEIDNLRAEKLEVFRIASDMGDLLNILNNYKSNEDFVFRINTDDCNQSKIVHKTLTEKNYREQAESSSFQDGMHGIFFVNCGFFYFRECPYKSPDYLFKSVRGINTIPTWSDGAFKTFSSIRSKMECDINSNIEKERDELQKNFDNVVKTIEIQQRFLDDADGANKFLNIQVDELQKRIDKTLYKLPWLNWKNIDGKMKGEIMDILKGKKDE